ncbi:hypothetical protein RM550_28600 [Streptomyces sp. DSM 41527]|uniref:Uncharacterized protein n=1 Tax=Streptomyces mooreae TaxID=3075523 RepID=A0ABU2TFD3_9ACTN|nr:hypothetical protein [Streptomyces sp. DSM 41527]MDT0459629.1 hypothetical protein [Streptomyces sp. DSM 41527]
MARTMSGTSRVTVFPLLHRWSELYSAPAGRCIVAYAATGKGGTDAVIGVIPRPDLADGMPSLMDVAARHAPSGYGPQGPNAFGSWLTCTGWSARVAPKVGQLDIPSVGWELTVHQTVRDLVPQGATAKSVYGHLHVYVGLFRLMDPVLMAQAEGVLARTDVAVREQLQPA